MVHLVCKCSKLIFILFVFEIPSVLTNKIVTKASALDVFHNLINSHLKVILETIDDNTNEELNHINNLFTKVVYSVYSLKYFESNSFRSHDIILKIFPTPIKLLTFHRYVSLVHVYLGNCQCTKHNLSKNELDDIYTSNPILVIYLFSGNFIQNQIHFVEQRLKYYVAKYSIMINNWSEVSIFCLTCPNEISASFFGNLKLFSRQLNGTNLKLQKVCSDLNYLQKTFKVVTCYLITRQISQNVRTSSQDHCAMQTLSDYLNFTLRFERWNTQEYDIYLGKARFVDNEYSTYFSNNRLAVIEFAYSITPWEFLIVKDNEEISNTSITGMFNLLVWIRLSCLYILIRVSAGLTVIITSYITTTKVQNNKVSLKISVIIVLKHLLGSGLYRKIKSQVHIWLNCRIHLINKLIWALSMSTLTNLAYRSELALFLAKSTNPSFPRTLEDFVNNVSTIVTYKSAVLSGGNVVCHLRYNLKELFNITKKEGLVYPKYHKTFGDKVSYVPKDDLGLQLFTSNVSMRLNHSLLKNKDSQGDFGVFDIKDRVELQKVLLDVLAPFKWVSPLTTVNLFKKINPFLVNRNYVYPIIKWGIAQMYESGLYNWWSRNYDVSRALENFDKTSTQIRQHNGSFEENMTPTNHLFAYHISKIITSSSRAPFNKSSPLTLDNLKVIWIFYFIFIFVITLVLSGEVFYHKLCIK